MAATTSADSTAAAAPPAPPAPDNVADTPNENATLLQQLRQRGNVAFAGKNMEDAKQFYSEALQLAVAHGINDNAHECHKIYSNRSLVNYNLQDYETALSDAEKSLELDPQWMKGFHRRGLALLALNRNAEAQAVYEAALKLQPRNKVIKSCLNKAKKAIASAGAPAAPVAAAAPVATPVIKSNEEFLGQYAAQTDTKIRMATLVTFWNMVDSSDRLEFVKRLMKIIGGSTYELIIPKLSVDHMVELPNNNYKHIKVPPEWTEYFFARSPADKVTFMENVWLKSTPAEQDLIIKDLQHFIGG